MITLPKSTLALLAQRLAPANNAAFVRRKLAESPTVQHLAMNETQECLIEDLKEISKNQTLNEDQITKAYCLIVALLLKNEALASSLVNIPGLDKLFWAKYLLESKDKSITSTSTVTLAQSIAVTTTSSAASQTEIKREN